MGACCWLILMSQRNELGNPATKSLFFEYSSINKLTKKFSFLAEVALLNGEIMVDNHLRKVYRLNLEAFQHLNFMLGGE